MGNAETELQFLNSKIFTRRINLCMILYVPTLYCTILRAVFHVVLRKIHGIVYRQSF
jgi:hypothetical protein